MSSNKEAATESNLDPAANGTYEHIGAQGGTEMMMRGLHERISEDLLGQFNIICSRVRDENIRPDKKNLLWLHDSWNDKESEHLQQESSRRRFAKLIFVSNYQQATFNIGRKVPFGDGVVLLNAIVPIPEHEKPKGEIIRLIYHTTPHRGLALLIPVFEALNAQFPNLHLDVFSSFKAYGWEQRDEPYKPLFERCMLNPNITYHGFQPNSVIRQALQKAHIYAYPNIWPETSGISVIEAMSAGCTVVCPNLAALPETCANFATMYGFHENYQTHANLFARVLAEAIRNFWSDTNQNNLRVQKMYFDKFYNWDLRAAQWTNLLTQLVSA